MKTTPEFKSLNNTANVKIYRVERKMKGTDEPFLVSYQQSSSKNMSF